jgi:hypothetical protein
MPAVIRHKESGSLFSISLGIFLVSMTMFAPMAMIAFVVQDSAIKLEI